MTECINARQVRAVVEGRASAWQKHLTLTPTKPGASEAVRPCHIPCSLASMCLCHRWVSHTHVASFAAQHCIACRGVHVEEVGNYFL